MDDGPVLVLNQGFEPHDVCRTRRALVLVFCGKAEMIEDGRGVIHTIETTFPLPSVIRLTGHVRRPYHQRRLTRLEVFIRDRFTCQYCGKETKELTIDHVKPRSQGGEHTWENVVSACKHCNRRKGGRTPEQASMKLLSTPRSPKSYGYHVPFQYFYSHQEWQKYLPSQQQVSPVAGVGLRITVPRQETAL